MPTKDTASPVAPAFDGTSAFQGVPAIRATSLADEHALEAVGGLEAAIFADSGTRGLLTATIEANNSADGNAMLGTSDGPWAAVSGRNQGEGQGVLGVSTSGLGVLGISYGQGSVGVWGDTDHLYRTGVLGRSTKSGVGPFGGYGVHGQGSTGVYGECIGVDPDYDGQFDHPATVAQGYGVLGKAIDETVVAVAGQHTGGQKSIAVLGTTTLGHGVHGESSGGSSGAGVFGRGTNRAYAGFFDGQVNVTSFLTKGGGGFLIDHPLDPTKKDLYHSFVESPDMKNLYDGIGVANARGELSVKLPRYFEALNEAFRYQLTPIGAPAPNLHVKRELARGTFTIAGAGPRQKVCWQVTGNRKDAWARENPMTVEPPKPREMKGRYRHPTAFGKPERMGAHWRDEGAAPVAPAPKSPSRGHEELVAALAPKSSKSRRKK